MLLAQHDDMVRALAPDTAPVLSRPAKLQGFLAQIEDASIHDSVEMLTLVFCGRIKKLNHLARDLCQVYGAERLAANSQRVSGATVQPVSR